VPGLGETVFDPFCGSGAIGEACIRLGRDYVGFDQDPVWVERTKSRLSVDFEAMTDVAGLSLCTMPRVVEVATTDV
jgi:tRNA G10  N-methylase Trm11